MTSKAATPEGSLEHEPLEIDKTGLLLSSPQEIVDQFKESDDAGQLTQLIDAVVSDDELLALVSWWERWLPKNHSKLIEQAVMLRRQNESGNDHELPLGLESKFTPKQLSTIFSNMGALQLNFGCSFGCKFCAVDAMPGVKESLTFKQVKKLIEEYGGEFPKGEQGGESAKRRTLFYCASDPSDYASEENGERRTYEDVHELATKHMGVEPLLKSREIHEEAWTEYMGTGRNKIISTLGLSRGKVEKLTEKMGEDMVTQDSRPRRGLGRDIMNDKSAIGKGGIGCFDGTVLTPRGLYNIVQTPVSERFPQGEIVVPIKDLSNTQVGVGDNFIEVLQRTVASNEPIREYGTNSKIVNEMIYRKDAVEYRVYVNGHKKYLLVDKDFIIQKVSDQSFDSQERMKAIDSNAEAIKEDLVRGRFIGFIYSDHVDSVHRSRYSDANIFFERIENMGSQQD